MVSRDIRQLRGAARQFFHGYVVVAAAFIVIFAMYGAFQTFGVFFNPLLTDFGWTRAVTAGAFSLRGLVHGGLSILSGRLNDRFGPRLLIIGSGLLVGSGYLLMSRVNTVWQIYVFYGLVIGFGMGIGYVPTLSTVARWFTRQRGLMTGIVAAASGVGSVIMPPLASRLIVAYGWRLSYIIVGLIVLIFIILAAQFMKRPSTEVGKLPAVYGETQRGTLVQTGVSFHEAVRSRQLWQFCGILTCLFFSVGLVTVHVVPHAIELGLKATSAANMLAIIGGVGIAGRLVMGGVVDRLGARPTLVINCIVMAVTMFLFAVAREPWALYLVSGLFGFAFGGAVSPQSAVVAELFGLKSHGVIFGVATFTSTIGLAIGPLVAGGIFDTTHSYHLAFLAGAIMSFAGLLLALTLKGSPLPNGL